MWHEKTFDHYPEKHEIPKCKKYVLERKTRYTPKGGGQTETYWKLKWKT